MFGLGPVELLVIAAIAVMIYHRLPIERKAEA